MSKTPFRLRSGNNIGGRNGSGVKFRKMGSSPAKDLDPHTGRDGHTHEGYTEGEERLISDEMGVKTYQTDYHRPGSSSGSGGGKVDFETGYKNYLKTNPDATREDFQKIVTKHWASKEDIPESKYYTQRTEQEKITPITPLQPQLTPVIEEELVPIKPRGKFRTPEERKEIEKRLRKKRRKKGRKKKGRGKKQKTVKLTCDAQGNCEAPSTDTMA